ncbi:MAG: hypothetical protein KDA45_14625, partial [Planctomycetales bacterium]|nr:hypothetical protein [Planctomycetales bacterium]
PNQSDEISVYGTENYYEPSPGRVRRFVYRTDGFVALRGGQTGGQMTTKPLRSQAKQLLLNYVVHDGGKLQVEVLDQAGQLIGRSQPLSGQAIDSPLVWEREPNFQAGPVQLRFKLQDADVFSLRFK